VHGVLGFRARLILPRHSPSGLKRLIHARDRSCTYSGQQPSTAIAQSQSRRLKMTYKLVHTTAIRTSAKGYPNTQCNSGMCVKFIP
jgi:hypothetical protein